MASAVQVRKDYSSDDLRRLARASDDADQTRRLLALAVILDGGSRGDAARTGGVGLQVVRDWVLRFNEWSYGRKWVTRPDQAAPVLAVSLRATPSANLMPSMTLGN